MHALGFLALVILAFTGTPAPLWAVPAPVCGDGLYLIDATGLSPEPGIPAFSTLRVTGGQVHLEGCAGAPRRGAG